jgi:hypothetical protein
MERQLRVPGVVAKSERGADRSGKYRQADPMAVAPESARCRYGTCLDRIPPANLLL